MFAIERPVVLYGLFAVFPALAVVFVRSRRFIDSIGMLSGHRAVAGRYRMTILVRSLLHALSWMLLIVSFAGVSWGTYRVPVRTSGDAVSFVFDISHSMTALDAAGGLTRLAAAARYANLLLQELDDIPVSAVLAKGDGIIAVPLTDDRTAITALTAALSPHLMTMPGSSLGRGVQAALRSFPTRGAHAAHVWVFTDGDETDDSLGPALAECVQQGVTVALIGFGGTEPVRVLAGDGVTSVPTALRAAQLERRAAEAAVSVEHYRNNRQPAVFYVDAAAAGSAVRLLASVRSSRAVGSSAEPAHTYEIRPRSKTSLFLTLAIVLFAASFIVTDFILQQPFFSLQKSGAVVLLVVCTLLIQSCAQPRQALNQVLAGTWNWHRGDYQRAAADFMTAAAEAESADSRAYALYGLAVTYMMQREYAAARLRLSQIPPSAPDALRASALYASGIIAYYENDYAAAAQFFRDTLRIDSSWRDAKINLELSLQRAVSVAAPGYERQQIVTDQSDIFAAGMERVLFERIRENDIERWKNSEQPDYSTSALDY
ncbi:MAG: VWA domain-containing protein [Treponema sp.]|nr:VWA domain-containing protein [Treponema sp.]